MSTAPTATLVAMKSLLIKVTCGAEDAERCNQAFNVAAAALAMGAEVELWLAGEAAWFGVPGKAEEFSLPLAAPLADLVAAINAGGTLVACSQCAARRGIGPDDLIEGVTIAGAAAFAARALADDVQALVY